MSQVTFKNCRIEKSEAFNGKIYTVVSVAAADAFSHPSRYRLQSMSQLGNTGNMIDVTCNLSGMVRHKTFFDKNTGQQRGFDEASVFFDVVTASPAAAPK